MKLDKSYDKLTLNGVIYNSKDSTSKYYIVSSIHPEDRTGYYGVPNMIYSTAPRVDCLEDRANHLAPEDDEDRLPPIKSNSDHCRAKSPVVHGPTEV